MSETRQFVHKDYTVGWICALPQTELVAATAMLDKEHPILPAADPKDKNSYILGEIGTHKIVIACLPSQATGKVSAATVANDMLRSFPSVRFGLMVGIGGGAPYYPEQQAKGDDSEADDDDEETRDIRLGDVVVSENTKSSEAVVQYDFGKSLQGRGFVHMGGKLDKPPLIVRAGVSGLQAKHKLGGNKIRELLDEILEKYPNIAGEFRFPASARDRLFKSNVVHVDKKKSCKVCCGTDNVNLVKRNLRHGADPHIHYGTIGSADDMMKDAILRDKWAREENIICFEMEAAGQFDSLRQWHF
jgi:nucleoside phosphorylase